MKLGSYALNFDGWKHALGYAAAAATPFAALAVLHVDHGKGAPYAAAGATVFCALVAFLCGAQSEAAFLKVESEALETAGVPVEVSEVVTKVTSEVVTSVTSTTPSEKEDTKP